MPQQLARLALGLVPAVVSVLAAACGGAPPAAQKDTGADPLSAAEAELAAAEARITGGVAADRLPGPGAGAAETSPPPPAEPARPEAQPRLQSGGGEAPASAGDADSCESACEALTAMKRAADRICELAPGERCDSARGRVAAAEKRVMEACPGCEA